MTVHRDERGMALVTVLMVILVLSLLGAGSLQAGIGSLELSRHDQDWHAALAAAEAGVDDYIAHLDSDGNYFTYSATNPPPDHNQAFTSYVPVPGPSSGSSYRYTPDPSTIAVDGTVKLTSTGKVNKAVRTVHATLRRQSFLDYLYFTDYETQDPASYTGSPFSASQAQTRCALYGYAGRDPACSIIVFFGDTSRQDVINGPLHSNDQIHISGTPRFAGPATTSWSDPAGKRWIDESGASHPTFASSGDPRYAAPLTMPPSATNLRSYTDAAQGHNGCLYTGPTRITFNANGTMSVLSPYTKASNCAFGTTTPASSTVPSDRVIYVQNIPSNPSDPNYGTCTGYPGGVRPVTAGDITPYSCKNGDAFVSGTVAGQLTLASANNIEVVGDLVTKTAPPAGTDLVGLIADNYVEIYHPVDSSGRSLAIPGGPPTRLQAAILSVNHSFRVQNYNKGAPVGTLNITGAIAQRYRGAVGTFGSAGPVSGYIKNYIYDTRLKYLSPPHYLDPVQSAWTTKTEAEMTPAP